MDIFFLRMLTPIWLLVLADGILVGLILKGFWKRRPELVLLLLLWVVQTTILGGWEMRVTPSDAFLAGDWEGLMRMGNPWMRTIDSYVVHGVMRVFWILAVAVPGLVLVLTVIRLVLRRAKEVAGLVFRIAAIGLVVMISYVMQGNVREWHRIEPCLAESTSPDGRLAVRLVPVNAFCDVNGVVLLRFGRSIWWIPMGTVGDQLTTRPGLRFEWGRDEVTLWVDNEATVFDTQTASVKRDIRTTSPPATQSQPTSNGAGT